MGDGIMDITEDGEITMVGIITIIGITMEMADGVVVEMEVMAVGANRTEMDIMEAMEVGESQMVEERVMNQDGTTITTHGTITTMAGITMDGITTTMDGIITMDGTMEIMEDGGTN